MFLNFFSKIKLVLIFLTLIATVGFFNMALARAAAIDDAKKSLDTAAGTAFSGTNTTKPDQVPYSGDGIPGLIGKLIGVALSFIGILFFGLMIYAGFQWMTARGNEAEVAKSKELIYEAIIGLIIVLAAYAITSYIGSTIAGQ